MNKIYEAFRWFRQDVRVTSQRGGKIHIKGKAIFPTVSRNKRQYIEEELKKAARTLAGKPIDVNHEEDLWLHRKREAEAYGEKFNDPKPHNKGHVVDAEYEDGAIEYVAEINHSEYVAKLKDMKGLTKEAYRKKWGKDPIYGVSISANYRYTREGATDTPVVPLGINFVRLSLVEDPEKPGVQGTTIELLETLNEGSVEECILTGTLLHEKYGELYEAYDMMVLNKMIGEEERKKHNLPKLFDENDPRNIYETDEEEDIGADIGEPFGDYKDHKDCVAKNQGKGDPDAYCASIRRRIEGETWEEIGETDEELMREIDAKLKLNELPAEETLVFNIPKMEKKEMTEKDAADNLQEKQRREREALEEKQSRELMEAEIAALKDSVGEMTGKLNSVIEAFKDFSSKYNAGKEKDTETTSKMRNLLKSLEESATELKEGLGKASSQITAVSESIEKDRESNEEAKQGIQNSLEEHTAKLEEMMTKLSENEEVFNSFKEEASTKLDENATRLTELGESYTAHDEDWTKFKSAYAEEKTALDEKTIQIEEKITEYGVAVGEFTEFKTTYSEDKEALVTKTTSFEQQLKGFDTAVNTTVESLKETIEQQRILETEQTRDERYDTLLEKFETLQAQIPALFQKVPEQNLQETEEDDENPPAPEVVVDKTKG